MALPKLVTTRKSLQDVNPSLAAQWHPTKNGSLTPKDVTPMSHKKVWWHCEKNHEWLSVVSNRSLGNSCPYCGGKAACEDNCLSTINPTLATQWHPTRNGRLTPKDVTPGSSKRAWWQCEKNHEWQAVISSRSTGVGCPFCTGKAACDDNCLSNINPTLAAEWHPTKNGSLTPKDVTPMSHKKVWWFCARAHEWRATVEKRSNGRRCPYCHSSTSQMELAIYCELKYLFKNIRHRAKILGQECDIYIPKYKIGVEIGGYHWHKNKYEQDKKKFDSLKAKGIMMLNLREKGLKNIADTDIFFSNKDTYFKLIRRIIEQLLDIGSIEESMIDACRKYLKLGTLANVNEYNKLLYMLPSPIPEASLQEQYATLATQWHPTRNGSLTPRDVTPMSHKKVWWHCQKDHEWQAFISNRARGSGCPYCAGQVATRENCLAILNPELAMQWHPTKNGSLTPKDVTPMSSKKVWWFCTRAHEWRATVEKRSNGRRCPYCAGKAVCEDNCLSTINPTLAAEWHPSKNGSLTPNDVTPMSNKKVWWQCDKNHEWQAPVYNRSLGRGCAYCSGRRH